MIAPDASIDGIDLYRVEADVNGNSRYVVHHSALITERDKSDAPEGLSRIEHLHALALRRANKIGGRKYRARWFGGGVVFQCCHPPALVQDIQRIREVSK